MFITRKAIPRRTFLRGVGATLALPLLDGMVPAFAGALDSTAKPPLRLSTVYIPNGAIMEKWTPATEGTAFQLSPILEPLGAFRDRMIVMSGLSHASGDSLPGEGGAGPHERAGATYLTGVHPKRTDGADIYVGISMDQIAAKELGKHTQLASLELGMDTFGIGGACENGWSCAYINTISWRTPSTPLPMETNPRAVFERLFGDRDTTDAAEQKTRIRENRSLLDSVGEAVASMMSGIGPTDRAKLSEYLEAIRDIERRIHLAEEQTARELPALERPPGIPASYDEHAKLMFDLQVLAYQTDLTRVITYMMGREKSDRPYREIGIADPHHPLTHHQHDPAKIAKVIQINIFHARMFSYFLERLRATPEGDGSLLDHVMVLYGSSLSDGNEHNHHDLPVMLVGGSAAGLKGGRHIRYPMDTPMPNLFVAMLDKFGVQMDTLGDSNGKLELLAV